MKSSYYLRNNATLAIGVIRSALTVDQTVSMAELSLLLPFLFDDKIVMVLNDDNQYVTIPSLITMNRISLANFNDRYLSLLPLVYQSLSLLLDVDAISISGGEILAKNMQLFDDMIANSHSRQLKDICKASYRLFRLADKEKLSDYYRSLKIEL